MKSVEVLCKEILAGSTPALAQAITLIESTKPEHRKSALELLEKISPSTDGAIRIAFSGSPGAGKSSLIEAIGMKWIAQKKKVGVLAVDPSSPISGGSILGDKTRMSKLAQSAFVRPSPNRGSLGGVARHTQETIELMSAAGFDYIILETVGVGQAEILAANMVDIFVLVQLPNAGDDLQGMKRGITELADFIVINKCDGEFETVANISKAQLQQALALFKGQDRFDVECVSAQTGFGLDTLIAKWDKFIVENKKTGVFSERRKKQRIAWFDREIVEQIMERAKGSQEFGQAHMQAIERVTQGKVIPSVEVAKVVETLIK